MLGFGFLLVMFAAGALGAVGGFLAAVHLAVIVLVGAAFGLLAVGAVAFMLVVAAGLAVALMLAVACGMGRSLVLAVPCGMGRSLVLAVALVRLGCGLGGGGGRNGEGRGGGEKDRLHGLVPNRRNAHQRAPAARISNHPAIRKLEASGRLQHQSLTLPNSHSP